MFVSRTLSLGEASLLRLSLLVVAAFLASFLFVSDVLALSNQQLTINPRARARSVMNIQGSSSNTSITGQICLGVFCNQMGTGNQSVSTTSINAISTSTSSNTISVIQIGN